MTASKKERERKRKREREGEGEGEGETERERERDRESKISIICSLEAKKTPINYRQGHRPVQNPPRKMATNLNYHQLPKLET